MGHLSRCTAVADALRERGVDVRCLGFGAEEPRELDGIRWEPVDEPVAADLIDSYSDRRDEFGARAAFVDEGEPPPGAKLVLGPGGLAAPRYACLRRPYWQPPQRQPGEEVRRVLVSTGAATPAAALAGEVAAALPQAEVRDPVGLPTLRDELEACDLAVTGAGQTMLEALATGRPVVAVVTATNQLGQAEAVSEAVVLAERDAAAEVAELAADPERRRTLAARARELVDGQGAHRVAEALLQLGAALE
jgi:spore coat polysaccharide biosynthesis predicted glycosyltransferase SpsG